jgi:hypothetical protein
VAVLRSRSALLRAEMWVVLWRASRVISPEELAPVFPFFPSLSLGLWIRPGGVFGWANRFFFWSAWGSILGSVSQHSAEARENRGGVR